MDTGKFVYRNQSGKIVMYVLILFGILMDITLIFSTGKLSILKLISINLFSILIPCFALKSLAKNPGFFEHGLAYYKHNRIVRFESYDKVVSVGCFVKSTSSAQFPALVFYKEDGEKVIMYEHTIQALVLHWKTLLNHNPLLKEKLTGSDFLNGDEASQGLFEFLKTI